MIHRTTDPSVFRPARQPLLWCVDLGPMAGVIECCSRMAAEAAIEGFPVWLRDADYRPAWAIEEERKQQARAERIRQTLEKP